MFLLLIGVSLLSDNDEVEDKQVSMNAVIEDFENGVENGEIIEDGYNVIDEKSYSSNRISGITSSIGSFIVDGASFVVDAIQGVVKAFVG